MAAVYFVDFVNESLALESGWVYTFLGYQCFKGIETKVGTNSAITNFTIWSAK